jgi:serine/threonine-protein kinase
MDSDRNRQTPDSLATRAGPPTPEDAWRALDLLANLDSPELAGASRDPTTDTETSRYQRQHLHAQGGTGQVWQARDRQLGRDIALKELLPEYEDEPTLRRRFLVEAQITGQLEHPGIVPVYELIQPPGEGSPCYTMRLVRGGRELSEVVWEYHQKRRAGQAGAVELRDLLQAFVSICGTLAYAHARGVVHRDLKGGNLILGPFGEVIVLDWGLARVLGQKDEAVAEPPVRLEDGGDATEAGHVLGTLAYMAPEQARGEVDRIDRRTDVFGLGAVLYEILTGRPPYTSAEPDKDQRKLDLLCQAHKGAVVPPRRVAPWVPRPLEAVCLKALAKEPEDRYATALELGEEVKRWLAGELVRAWPEPWAVRAWRRVKRRPLLATGMLVALLVGGAAWGYIEWRQSMRLATEREKARQRGRQVAEMLGQIEAGRAEARTASSPRARSLTAQMLATAQEADALLAEDGAEEGQRQRVRELVAELQQEERDRQMLARLEEARYRGAPIWKQGHFNWAGSDAAWAAAFRWYGIDVQKLPAEEATRLMRSRAIRVELAAALDFWAALARAEGQVRRFRDLARAVDDDPGRNRVRDALGRNDRQALEKLATPARIRSLPAATLVLLGASLRNAGAHEAALRVLRQAQRRYPDDVAVNNELGGALLARHPPLPEEAIRFFSVSLALRPDSAWAFTNLGEALREKGQLDEAIAHHRRALVLQPNFGSALIHLGGALIEKKELDEAITHLRKAVELQPNRPAAHNNLGLALEGKDQLTEAITHFRKAIASNPTFAEGHTNLGDALRKKGHAGEAIKHLRKASELQPNDARFHYNLAIALLEQRRAGEAVEHLRTAIKLRPNLAQAHHTLGLTLRDKGELNAAIEHLRKTIELQPNDPAAHNNLGLALYTKGQRDEAIQHYRWAIELQPGNAPAHTNLGIALSARGEGDKALEHLRKAVELQPTLAMGHNNLGTALLRNGRVDEAIQHYRKAIDLQPGHADFHYNLALALRQKEEADEAIKHFHKAIDLRPSADAHYNLGRALRDKGQLDQAITHFRKTLDLQPNLALAHFSLGMGLLHKGQVDEALEHLRKASKLRPNSAVVHNAVGAGLAAKGEVEEAIQHYRLAIHLDPKFTRAHINLGDTHLQKGQFTEALAAFQRCRALLQPDAALREPVARMIRNAEQMIALDRKLPAVLSGKTKPASEAERVALARLCQQPYKRLFVSSARLWENAFASEPGLANDLKAGHRYNAACAAALAAAGQGPQAGKLTDEQRSSWRKQALAWLQADLTLWAKQAETAGAASQVMAQRTLRHWQSDPDLAGVRDPAALARLSAEEREACRALWAQVAKLLDRVGDAKKP